MFENERDLKKVIDGLKIDTTPNLAHKAHLKGQMLTAFNAAGPAAAVCSAPSGMGIAIKLAVAATIVVGAVVGIRQFGPADNGALILEPVRLATHEMPWLHATVTEYREEGDRTEEQWHNLASKMTYIQAGNGFVYCSEYGQAPRHLVYNPRAKSVLIKRLPPAGFFGVESAYTLLDAVAAMASKAQEPVREWSDYHECRAVHMYELEKARPGIRFRGKVVGLLRIRLMTDPETERLVAARVEYEDHDETVLARQDWIVEYPRSGPNDIYALGVPRTASVVDVTAQPIGTPPDQPRPISTPAPTGRF